MLPLGLVFLLHLFLNAPEENKEENLSQSKHKNESKEKKDVLDELAEVLVGERGGGASPGANESGPVSVAATKSVGARERNNLLVIKALICCD
jgi:hypothetical protein